MAFKVQALVTVSKVEEKSKIERAWKEKPTMDYPTGRDMTITDDLGWHVTLKELGIAVPCGKDRPDVMVGDQLVWTLEKPNVK